MYSDNSGPRLAVSYTSGAPDGEPEITIRTNGGSTRFHPDDLALIEKWLEAAGWEHARWLSYQKEKG